MLILIYLYAWYFDHDYNNNNNNNNSNNTRQNANDRLSNQIRNNVDGSTSILNITTATSPMKKILKPEKFCGRVKVYLMFWR